MHGVITNLNWLYLVAPLLVTTMFIIIIMVVFVEPDCAFGEEEAPSTMEQLSHWDEEERRGLLSNGYGSQVRA